MTVATKRVYAQPASTDGYRVLVDRLWPRGLSRAVAEIDLWLRDIAPSTELRTWFGHDPERWTAFVERYHEELAGHGALLDLLVDLEHQHGTLTLVYGARDEGHNQAVALADVLRDRPVHSHD